MQKHLQVISLLPSNKIPVQIPFIYSKDVKKLTFLYNGHNDHLRIKAKRQQVYLATSCADLLCQNKTKICVGETLTQKINNKIHNVLVAVRWKLRNTAASTTEI
jgi:hypothetical protein